MDQVSALSQRHPPAWVRPSPRVRGGVRCTSKGGARRSPSGQARPRTGLPTRGGRCSNGWRDAVRGIRCRHRLGSGCSALQERPARWPVGCSVQLCEGEPTSATSVVTASLAQGQASKGQVTTATPLRSSGAGHEGGPREPVVDARAAGVVNGLGEDARRNRPDSQALPWASDACARRLHLRDAGRARAAPGFDDCAIGLWW